MKQFNENVAITLAGRNIVTLEDNKTVIVIRYEIINKSKNKSIKSVNWLSGYTFNEQIIATQNIQIDFNPILKAKEKISIETNIPLEQIPSHARHIFASPDAPIGLITGAKKLEFTKGKPIIIE